MLVSNRFTGMLKSPLSPNDFMLLDRLADKVATIRDFRHALYIVDGAE